MTEDGDGIYLPRRPFSSVGNTVSKRCSICNPNWCMHGTIKCNINDIKQ